LSFIELNDIQRPVGFVLDFLDNVKDDENSYDGWFELPGLASICCLLFTPQAEFRTDEKRTRYTGALCGLGYDSQGAIYTDNDVETVFDVEIDVQDITMVCI